MKKAKSESIWAIGACLLLITTMCSPSKETVKEAVDTSTVDDWKTNCALYHEYHNKLIFSAAETATSDGKRLVAWAARDRAEYLAVFQRLALDGAPALKERRDLILKEAGRAPGGGSVMILPKLDEMVSSLWKDIEAAAAKHGILCRPEKNT